MTNRIRTHVRQNLVGYVALFFALSGTAVATHESILSSDIVDSTIQSVDIKNGHVRTADVRNDGLSAADLAAASVGESELDPEAFASGDIDLQSNGYGISPNAIQSSEIEDGQVTGADISESSLGTVPNADKLDGLHSSAFVGNCKTGSIRGYIRVNGNLSIPSSFSTTGTSLPYNCAGSVPLVRRIDTGTYELCFPNNPSIIGIGNAVYMGEDSDLDNFVTWHAVLTPNCSTTTFRVRVRDNNSDLENAPLFFAVL